ncbi:SDR family oxidoreductase [Candidatus Poribacteria bacterium]|nr:SDR family oxidoreductase [Candidatus Poribacteria bacterium]
MALFDGRTAVITGGSSGIGKAFAEFLADEGAHVALVARNAERLAVVADALRKRHGGAWRVVAISADVRDPGSVERMARQVRETLGSVDIVINSAGLGIWKTVADMTPDEWGEVLDTSLTGTFLVTRAFIGEMVERGSGHVINLSSVAGKLGFATGSAYCAAKWGVLGFTRALAAEVRPHGVRVDALCPGTTDTPFKNSPAASAVRLDVADVIAAARYVMTLPRQVRVDDVVIYPQ